MSAVVAHLQLHRYLVEHGGDRQQLRTPIRVLAGHLGVSERSLERWRATCVTEGLIAYTGPSAPRGPATWRALPPPEPAGAPHSP